MVFVDRRDMGPLPFLKIGTIMAVLSLSGKMPCSNEELKRGARIFDENFEFPLIICTVIWSCPVELLFRSLTIAFSTSHSIEVKFSKYCSESEPEAHNAISAKKSPFGGCYLDQ